MASINSLFNVAGKSVLVTGGGRGIGKMIAEGFVANGSTVFISSRDQKALESTAEELNDSATTGGKCIPIVGNLNTREGCEELAASVAEKSPSGLCSGLRTPTKCAYLISAGNLSRGMSW